MKGFKKIVAGIMLAIMVLTVGGIIVEGTVSYAASAPIDTLKSVCRKGKNDHTGQYALDYTKKSYKKDGGGYYLYAELTAANTQVDHTDMICEEKFNELTAGGRRDFLTDMIKLGNCEVDYWKTQKKTNTNSSTYVTASTLTSLMEELQNVEGAGSQLIATLMSETKPDYATANRIYKPFSGVVGTIIGFVSIMIMALLGVTMALDIAYITIPAFQLFLDGDEGGGEGGKGGKGMAKIISQEARNAVKAANDGGGSAGQGGSGNKLAISVYFKHRWKGLVVLGICLLYLVQGQIYSFVAWVLDLVSGFVGF